MTGRLKKRRDFLAAAKGSKAARRGFVVEARRREDCGPARVGFTVSKRTAKEAVKRNRIRRRLKEAVRSLPAELLLRGHDYVLVGRQAALTAPFAEIRTALAGAVRQASGAPPASARAEART